MTKKDKAAFSVQEEQYLEQLKATRAKLEKLRNKRALEIGNLAIKNGLGDLSNEALAKAFSKIG